MCVVLPRTSEDRSYCTVHYDTVVLLVALSADVCFIFSELVCPFRAVLVARRA